MRLTCVNTGSEHGNAYVLEDGQSKILLDSGCTWREVERACDYDVSNIDMALITHEHG